MLQMTISFVRLFLKIDGEMYIVHCKRKIRCQCLSFVYRAVLDRKKDQANCEELRRNKRSDEKYENMRDDLESLACETVKEVTSGGEGRGPV